MCLHAGFLDDNSDIIMNHKPVCGLCMSTQVIHTYTDTAWHKDKSGYNLQSQKSHRKFAEYVESKLWPPHSPQQ